MNRALFIRFLEDNGLASLLHSNVLTIIYALVRMLAPVNAPDFLVAEVAQSVEQRPEKPCVASSILALGTFYFPECPCKKTSLR